MDDAFRSVAVRLIDALGHAVDRESFADVDAWAFVEELGHYAAERRPLPPLARQVLVDLLVVLQRRSGASPVSFLTALEQQLGPGPVPVEVLEQIVTWARQQIAGFEPKDERARSALTGAFATWVPHKNYEFK